MERLTPKEEEIMQVLWSMERAFVKELIEEMEEPKPHYNTVSTIIRILEEKGFVGHKAYGKSHQYYPMITKTQYKRNFLKSFVQNYFSDSYKDMVSFFAKDEVIDEDDLIEIRDMILREKSEE